MIQTWHARKNQLQLQPFDVLIIDEFHLFDQGIMSTDFLEKFNTAKIIGMTATPITADGFKLDNYDVLIDPYRTSDLQKMGWLVKDRWYSSAKNLGLDGLELQNGDYIERQLSNLMNQKTVINNVFDNFKKFAFNKKTIIFAVSIDHAESLFEYFKSQNVSCEILHSKIEQLSNVRDSILGKFKTGEIQVLINVGILTTGFDEPSVECIVLVRPTKSLRLFIQIAGRGLRIHEGKTECLFLDCANNVWEHGLATDDFDFTVEKIDKPKKKKVYMRLCPMCESASPYHRATCISCGYEFIKDERESSYRILNEEIVELDIDNVAVRERGLPNLKHIVELLFIAKNLNEKTKSYPNKVIQKFITDMHSLYCSKFDNELEFYKFFQSQVIQVVRKKISFYSIKYKFMDHFKEENTNLINQLMLMRGFHTELCPACSTGKMKLNRNLLAIAKQEIYTCQNCSMQYGRNILDGMKNAA
jgi:superfamily II DNA or RNA helicase